MSNLISNSNINIPTVINTATPDSTANSTPTTDVSSVSQAAKNAADLVIKTLQADNSQLLLNSSGSNTNPAAPELTVPTSTNTTAKTTEIIATIANILGDNVDLIIKKNADTFNAIRNGMENQANDLAQKTETASQYSSQATDIATSQGLNLSDAQSELNNAQTALNGLSTDDPSYEGAQTRLELAKLSVDLNRAKQSLDQAKADPDLQSTNPQLLNQAKERLNSAQNLHNNATLALTDFASKEAEKANSYLDDLKSFANVPPNIEKQQLSVLAKLIALISSITDLMNASAKERLDREHKMFTEMQSARQKSLTESANKYEEEVRKAEQANKTMGCVGKIIGAVLIAVGAIVSVLTSPTGVGIAVGIGIAAIGLAMLVADTVLESMGQKSLTERMMEPIMKNIIQPLIDLISKAISDSLKKQGVDEATADKIGMGISMAVVSVLMIAVIVLAIVVARGAAAKLVTTLADKFANMAAKNIVQKVIQQVIQQAAKLTAKKGAEEATKASVRQSVVTALKYGEVAGQVLHAGVSAGAGIYVAKKTEEASKDLAAMIVNQSVLDQLRSLLQKAIETFNQAGPITQQLTNSMTKAIQGNMASTNFILGNIGKSA